MEDLTTVQVGDGAVGEDGDCDADDVSEVSLFFFCNSRKHLEQQSPVALFPKKPHPCLHNLGSLGVFVVVCSLIVCVILM